MVTRDPRKIRVVYRIGNTATMIYSALEIPSMGELLGRGVKKIQHAEKVTGKTAEKSRFVSILIWFRIGFPITQAGVNFIEYI